MNYLYTLLLTHLLAFQNAILFAQSSIDWVYHSPIYRQTFSSPKAVDLNGDDYDDIIISNMIFEQDSLYSEVICLNGRNGDVIWKCNLDNKYLYGNTVFCDVNNDNIKDVFIAGGFGGLYCINGNSGTLIWKFYNDTIPAEKNNVFNFYNPKVINDQNRDGINDLIIINGGNQLIEPHAPGRKTGYLLIVDASNGHIIAKDSFPDRKESYFSPIIFTQGNDTMVIYGTGGETDTGSLWLCELKDVRENKVFLNSTRIDGPYNKGFIQPCILANFNQDTILDILSINLDGKMNLLDGNTHQYIWQNNFTGFEIYTEPSIVFANSDNIPDIYLKLSKGEFNDEAPYQGFKGIVIDGQNGTYTEIDSLGYYYCFTTACSFIKNGQNKILQVHNILQNDTTFVGLSEIDINNGSSTDTVYMPFASCYNSTPFLKNLNSDSLSELITVFNTRDSGYYVICKSTDINSDSILWGTYYGNDENSIFNSKNILTSTNEQVKKISSLKIQPNPASQFIQLTELKNSIKIDIFIYNTSGGIIKYYKDYRQNNIDISSLQNGIYLVKVKENSIEYFGKFIKM